MTEESTNALLNLELELNLLNDLKKFAWQIQKGSSEYTCEVLQATGLTYDGLTALAERIYDIDMRNDSRIVAAAREFAETWLKYDGKKNLVEAAS